jgi:hypothetical protein
MLFVDASSHETIQADHKKILKRKTVQENESLTEWLSWHTDNWLLCLDNADDPGLNLQTYIPQCRHGNVIITSRNPHLKVHTRPNGSSAEVHGLEVADAVDLLLVGAGYDSPTLPDREDAEMIVKVGPHPPIGFID